MMNKTKAALALASLAVFVFFGCQRKPTLNIYNWAYYTPDSIVEKFENEFGVRVRIDEYASNEEMYAKLKSSGRVGFDLVFPTQDYAAIMIKQGMLERIDHSRIPNIVNIEPVLVEKFTYDPGIDYSVPYYWGVIGVIVNKSRVSDYEESWSIFGRPDLRMTMLDDMREVMGAALMYLGYSLNSRDPNQILEARNLINNEWKPNLIKFDSETFGTGYANGEFWVIHCYPNTVFEEIAGNEELMANTVFFSPREGASAFIDNMVIPKGARNADLAHEFINFIHRPEIYAEFCDYFAFYPTANVPARDIARTRPWYPLEDVLKAEITYDLEEALDLWTHEWDTSIRVGN